MGAWVEDNSLGTGGALGLASSYLNSEFVLVMNGDSYAEMDLNMFWAAHLDRRADLTLLMRQVSDRSHFGGLEVKDDHRITRFAEKTQTDGAGWINAGVYLIRRALTESIPGKRETSLEREFFPKWANHKCYGYPGKGLFFDIGTPESYEQRNNFFKSVGKPLAS